MNANKISKYERDFVTFKERFSYMWMILIDEKFSKSRRLRRLSLDGLSFLRAWSN